MMLRPRHVGDDDRSWRRDGLPSVHLDARGTGVAPGTADAVLTFRNVHNWRMGYLHADKTDYSAAADPVDLFVALLEIRPEHL
jgi:hypothetical protein